MHSILSNAESTVHSFRLSNKDLIHKMWFWLIFSSSFTIRTDPLSFLILTQLKIFLQAAIILNVVKKYMCIKRFPHHVRIRMWKRTSKNGEGEGEKWRYMNISVDLIFIKTELKEKDIYIFYFFFILFFWRWSFILASKALRIKIEASNEWIKWIKDHISLLFTEVEKRCWYILKSSAQLDVLFHCQERKIVAVVSLRIQLEFSLIGFESFDIKVESTVNSRGTTAFAILHEVSH